MKQNRGSVSLGEVSMRQRIGKIIDIKLFTFYGKCITLNKIVFKHWLFPFKYPSVTFRKQ